MKRTLTWPAAAFAPLVHIQTVLITLGKFSTFYPISLYFVEKKLSGLIPIVSVQFIFLIATAGGMGKKRK